MVQGPRRRQRIRRQQAAEQGLADALTGHGVAHAGGVAAEQHPPIRQGQVAEPGGDRPGAGSVGGHGPRPQRGGDVWTLAQLVPQPAEAPGAVRGPRDAEPHVGAPAPFDVDKFNEIIRKGRRDT